MDKQSQIIVLTFGLAALILLVTKPKGMKKDDFTLKGKYQTPKVAPVDAKKQKEDAVTGMQAMKDAIAKKEPARELDKLKDMIFKEYGIKVMISRSTGKLSAMSADGKCIAEEA